MSLSKEIRGQVPPSLSQWGRVSIEIERDPLSISTNDERKMRFVPLASACYSRFLRDRAGFPMVVPLQPLTVRPALFRSEKSYGFMKPCAVARIRSQSILLHLNIYKSIDFMSFIFSIKISTKIH